MPPRLISSCSPTPKAIRIGAATGQQAEESPRLRHQQGRSHPQTEATSQRRQHIHPLAHVDLREPPGSRAGHPEQHNGCDSLLSVDLYIPGCPPHPLTILDGILRLLGRMEDTHQ